LDDTPADIYFRGEIQKFGNKRRRRENKKSVSTSVNRRWLWRPVRQPHQLQRPDRGAQRQHRRINRLFHSCRLRSFQEVAQVLVLAEEVVVVEED
jgi:hypothetical protein